LSTFWTDPSGNVLRNFAAHSSALFFVVMDGTASQSTLYSIPYSGGMATVIESGLGLPLDIIIVGNTI
jgi:hypothetical protein